MGRTGLFELASGGGLRRAIATGLTSEQLRQTAVKEGMQPLRDAGMQLVVGGATSLEEIQRALSGKPPTPPPPQPAPAATPRPGSAGPAKKKP